MIRLIDLLVVRKDSTGAVATLTATDLDWEEASSFGALVGALMGWGTGGTEGAATGAIAGAAELADGHAFGEESRRALTDSVRQQLGGDRPRRARLGKAVASGHRARRRRRDLQRLAEGRRADRTRHRERRLEEAVEATDE